MPTSAIIAITLNCNSRCIMCDIWKNKIPNELPAETYLKLPATLTDINITGGEPFLRKDIVEIVRNMKTACPKVRFTLNTNGFMPHKIIPDMKMIYDIDPKFGFRVSIDGVGNKHDEIRRIPGGYDKIMKTLNGVRKIGFTDLGISFTLGNYNMDELPKIQDFCRREGLQFSLTVTSGSAIYFGKDKASYRPTDKTKLKPLLENAARMHYRAFRPKEMMRGWFVSKLLEFQLTGKRALPCTAGTDFFYLDSIGNVYTCHLKPWKMGNIRNQSFSEVMANRIYTAKVASCNACWMVCTAKSAMKSQLFTVALDALKEAGVLGLSSRQKSGELPI